MKKHISGLSNAWPVVSLALALIATTAAAQNASGAHEVKTVPQPAMAATPKAIDAVIPTQDAMTQAPSGEEEFEVAPSLQVGDAAASLLAWQRDGVVASPTARPIAGDVAQRSYERYLKSFEYPIPERLLSTIKSGNTGNSGSK